MCLHIKLYSIAVLLCRKAPVGLFSKWPGQKLPRLLVLFACNTILGCNNREKLLLVYNYGSPLRSEWHTYQFVSISVHWTLGVPERNSKSLIKAASNVSLPSSLVVLVSYLAYLVVLGKYSPCYSQTCTLTNIFF